MAVQHLGAIVSPVADRRIGRGHLHLVGVVRVEEIKRWARIPTLEADLLPGKCRNQLAGTRVFPPEQASLETQRNEGQILEM